MAGPAHGRTKTTQGSAWHIETVTSSTNENPGPRGVILLAIAEDAPVCTIGSQPEA